MTIILSTYVFHMPNIDTWSTKRGPVVAARWLVCPKCWTLDRQVGHIHWVWPPSQEIPVTARIMSLHFQARGSQPKPSFTTGILWGGHTQHMQNYFFNVLPSLKLTVHQYKWMVGIRSGFLLGDFGLFSGAFTVSFREGITSIIIGL